MELVMSYFHGWGAKAGSVLAIGAVITLFINLADSRYAWASDMRAIKSDRHAEKVQALEDKVSDIEDSIYVIEVEDMLTNREKSEISKLENRKSKYLRRLSDVMAMPH
jgi:hypothetical protein